MNVDEEAIDGGDVVDSVSQKKKNPKRKLFVDDDNDEDFDETETTVDFLKFPTPKTVLDDQYKSIITLHQKETY